MRDRRIGEFTDTSLSLGSYPSQKSDWVKG